MDNTFHRIFVIVEFPVSTDRLVSSPHRWHTSNVVPMLFSIRSYENNDGKKKQTKKQIKCKERRTKTHNVKKKTISLICIL